MKCASDGWMGGGHAHTRENVQCQDTHEQEQSTASSGLVASHSWQLTRRTAHGARTSDLPYTARVKDPTGLLSRPKFTAPDRLRPG